MTLRLPAEPPDTATASVTRYLADHAAERVQNVTVGAPKFRDLEDRVPTWRIVDRELRLYFRNGQDLWMIRAERFS